MAGWLDDVLGPTPAPRVVSTTRHGAPTAPTAPGGAPPGFDIQALLAKLDAEQKAANASGLEQYGALMDTANGVQKNVLGAGGLYDQAVGLQDSMGGTRNRQINENEIRGKATSDQDLINRGLGNTTIRSTAQRGIASDAESQRSDVAEQVAGAKAGLLTQRAGAEAQIGGMKGDAILSKTNTPTNSSALYAQLLQQLMANSGSGNSGRYTPNVSVGPFGGR